MDDDRQIMRGNGVGLLEFLDSKGERGELNRTTARAFRIASKKILEVESLKLADIDVRKVDVPGLLERFATLYRADFTPESLETYRSRFRRSVVMYLSWLDGDQNWRTAGLTAAGSRQATQRASRRTTTRRPSVKLGLHDAGGATETLTVDVVNVTPDASARLMTYDVPLRPNLIVKVTLPLDLTPEDADRFAAFIRVLAFSPSHAGSESKSPQGG